MYEKESPGKNEIEKYLGITHEPDMLESRFGRTLSKEYEKIYSRRNSRSQENIQL